MTALKHVIKQVAQKALCAVARAKYGKGFDASIVPWNIFSVLTMDKTAHVRLGCNVVFRQGSKVLVRENASLAFGDEVFLNFNAIVTCRNHIEIGDKTIIGPNALIFDHDHDYSASDPSGSFVSAPILVGERVWIGGGAVVTKGCSVGDRSIVAANCVVVSDVEESVLVGGVPQKELKRLAAQSSS